MLKVKSRQRFLLIVVVKGSVEAGICFTHLGREDLWSSENGPKEPLTEGGVPVGGGASLVGQHGLVRES